MPELTVTFALAVDADDARPMFLDENFYAVLAVLERARTVKLEIVDDNIVWCRNLRMGFVTLSALDSITWSHSHKAQLESQLSGPGVTGQLRGVLAIQHRAAGAVGCDATFTGSYEVQLPPHLKSFTAVAGQQLSHAIALRGDASKQWALAR